MAIYLGSTAVKFGSATKNETGGGTETEIVLQSKTVSPNTSVQTVTPDDGYNGLSQVTVNAIKTQSKSITPSTQSQTITPDSDYDGLSQVVVNAISTQSKSVTPSTSSQTVKPDSGYSGLSQVTVSAIKTQSKSATPSTTSQTIEPDNGYDGLSKVTVSAMPTATQATPNISVSSSGLITASATQSAGYVSSGTKSNTKQLTTKGATTWTPSTNNQTISSGTYLTGTQTIKGDSNLIASNIKSGVSIFGVQGSCSANSTKTYADYVCSNSPTSDSTCLYLNTSGNANPVMPKEIFVLSNDPSIKEYVYNDGEPQEMVIAMHFTNISSAIDFDLTFCSLSSNRNEDDPAWYPKSYDNEYKNFFSVIQNGSLLQILSNVGYTNGTYDYGDKKFVGYYNMIAIYDS